jgi:hypothetical protein
LTGSQDAEFDTALPELPFDKVSMFLEMPLRSIIFRLSSFLWLEGKIDKLGIGVIPKVRIYARSVPLGKDRTKANP